MIKHNQNGAVGALVLCAFLCIALLVALGFGAWAYSGREDYKKNVDAKVAAAVTVAQQQQTVVDNAHFAEVEKQPLRTYDGPEAYGSIIVNFPKDWSGYVDDTGGGGALVAGYFSPGVVPSVTDTNSVFALNVQVLDTPYSTTIGNYTSEQQTGNISMQAYALPKVPSAVGVEVTGAIFNNGSGSGIGTMVILPLRSETIEIWTDGTQYLSDFNNLILPNFSFSP